MTRPRDWWPLAESDPVPGEPEDLAALGKHMAQAAAEIDKMARLLPDICTSEVWDSDAGDEFRAKAATTATGIGKAHRRFFTVATALGQTTHGGSGYAARLQEHQDAADAAINAVNGTGGGAGSEDERRSTWGLLLAATHGADPASPPTGPAADPAAKDATPVTGPRAGPMPQASPGSIPPELPAFGTDTAQVAVLKQRYNTTIQQLRTSASQISQARDGQASDAGAAAQLIRTAIDNDGLKNPSGLFHSIAHAFDSARHFVASHWAQFVADLANVAGIIATVCGILAMVFAFIPGLEEFAALFETVALLAQALALVCHVILLATGHGSWMDVIMDTIALVTFGVGKGLIGGAEATAKISEEAASAYTAIMKEGDTVDTIIRAGDGAAGQLSAAARWTFRSKVLDEVKQVVSVKPVYNAALQALKDGKLGDKLGTGTMATLAGALKRSVGMASPEITEALKTVGEAGEKMPYASGVTWSLSTMVESNYQLFRITQGTAVSLDVTGHVDQILHMFKLNLPGWDNASSLLGPGGG